MKSNKSIKTLHPEDLPLTLPPGALGEKEPPRKVERKPSTPTEIIYESEESEEEPSPPRRDVTPDKSSELSLSHHSDLFKSKKRKNG